MTRTEKLLVVLLVVALFAGGCTQAGIPLELMS